MRLSYVEPVSPVTEAIRLHRGGQLHELDRTLLHSPPLAARWNSMLDTVCQETSIPADTRELAICRVAALNSAWFEWKHHYPLALEAGIAESLMQLVKMGKTWDLSGMEDMECGTLRWTILRYADAMTLNVCVPDSLFEDLKLWWSEKEIVELTAIIASYNMAARFQVALDVGEMNTVH